MTSEDKKYGDFLIRSLAMAELEQNVRGGRNGAKFFFMGVKNI
jgi:hypothetical protein